MRDPGNEVAEIKAVHIGSFIFKTKTKVTLHGKSSL